MSVFKGRPLIGLIVVSFLLCKFCTLLFTLLLFQPRPHLPQPNQRPIVHLQSLTEIDEIRRTVVVITDVGAE